MTFKQWIKQFVNEDSKRGELAKVVWDDIHFPNTNRWAQVNYRLHLVNNGLDIFLTFNKVWQFYKAEHGENILYFDLIDTDNNTVFSEFIKEKEAYQFMFKLQELGINFDLISEAENAGSEEEDCFIIEIDETFKRFYYSDLDEVINELNRFKNVVPFPLGMITK